MYIVVSYRDISFDMFLCILTGLVYCLMLMWRVYSLVDMHHSSTIWRLDASILYLCSCYLLDGVDPFPSIAKGER